MVSNQHRTRILVHALTQTGCMVLVTSLDFHARASSPLALCQVLNPWPVDQIQSVVLCYVARRAPQGSGNVVAWEWWERESPLPSCPISRPCGEPCKLANVALHARLCQCMAGSGYVGSQVRPGITQHEVSAHCRGERAAVFQKLLDLGFILHLVSV